MREVLSYFTITYLVSLSPGPLTNLSSSLRSTRARKSSAGRPQLLSILLPFRPGDLKSRVDALGGGGCKRFFYRIPEGVI